MSFSKCIKSLLVITIFTISCTKTSNTTNTTGTNNNNSNTDNNSGTYNDLFVPPAITGNNFNLTLDKATKQLKTGAATPTYGYNGNSFWGPTLIMNQGDALGASIDLKAYNSGQKFGFQVVNRLVQVNLAVC